MGIMGWLAIIGWIIANAPDIIAFIRRIFGRAKLSVKNRERKEKLRVRLSSIIQSKLHTKAEKRLLVRAEVTRVEHEMLQEELVEQRLA